MKGLIYTLALIMLTGNASAAWKLDNTQSQLNFISTKNAQVSELHHFNMLSGTLSNVGDLKVSVDVAQVETAIPVRNERMRKYLFDGSPATLQAKLGKDIMAMSPGQSLQTQIDSTITINGKSQQQSITVIVSKTTDNQYVATTAAPFLVIAENFNLITGIEKLQELAKLKSITFTVPVSFSVTFNQI